MTVFWDVTQCSLVEISLRFTRAYCLYHQGDNDGGSKRLWNVGQFLLDYTAKYHTTHHNTRDTENLNSQNFNWIYLLYPLFAPPPSRHFLCRVSMDTIP
jgi:hypothetical protein